jgi:hypothetical protein
MKGVSASGPKYPALKKGFSSAYIGQAMGLLTTTLKGAKK